MTKKALIHSILYREAELATLATLRWYIAACAIRRECARVWHTGGRA
jgi:hypothetical protein